jgi:ABC-type transporter Mla maintaining outer membrane lipid asymmetry ATPase subunit MlaF
MSASHVADRVAFLDEGKVRFLGTFQEARDSSDARVREFVRGGMVP